jgi:dephospho-CoA kinase
MTVKAPILRVGLTGGIATGKSTVARFLSELGVFVLDADHLAHMAIAPGGAAYDEVVAHFGERIQDGDGRIDRLRLADLVFEDAESREALNRMVHPKVRAEADRRIKEYSARALMPLAVVDAALLVETGGFRDFDRLIVVHCRRETQVERLVERDGMTPEQAEARIGAQAPATDKLAVADYVIDTDDSLEEVRRDTENILAQLMNDYDRRFRA